MDSTETTDRHTDRQSTDRQAGSQVDRQTDRHFRQKDRQILTSYFHTIHIYIMYNTLYNINV